MAGNTAYKIIEEERARFLDAQDYFGFTTALAKTQELEEAIGIWEFGKWCANGALERLDIKRQIKYQGTPPDHTAWDALINISDDEGMRIHAATVGLAQEALDLIYGIYRDWKPLETVRRELRMRRELFYKLRRDTLQEIAERLARSN
jgi:hypothetical protein